MSVSIPGAVYYRMLDVCNASAKRLDGVAWNYKMAKWFLPTYGIVLASFILTNSVGDTSARWIGEQRLDIGPPEEGRVFFLSTNRQTLNLIVNLGCLTLRD